MLRRVLASSRFLMGAAVLGAFLSSVLLILFALISTVVLIGETVRDREPGSVEAKRVTVEVLELADVFLLGTVLYIIALGLYGLFIDPNLPTPSWLQIRTLEDLKERLVGSIVLLLGVTFLGEAVTWQGDEPIIEFGVAIAVVIGALVLLLHIVSKIQLGSEREGKQPSDERSVTTTESEPD